MKGWYPGKLVGRRRPTDAQPSPPASPSAPSLPSVAARRGAAPSLALGSARVSLHGARALGGRRPLGRPALCLQLGQQSEDVEGEDWALDTSFAGDSPAAELRLSVRDGGRAVGQVVLPLARLLGEPGMRLDQQWMQIFPPSRALVSAACAAAVSLSASHAVSIEHLRAVSSLAAAC